MKIISFGNARYKRVALNWATHLHRLGIYNYTIYALDDEIHDFLIKKSVNVDRIDLNNVFNKNGENPYKNEYKWNLRLEFIFNLLKDNHNVLHSDLDAVWLKSPLEFISDYDIVSSTGILPKSISNKFGWSLCMGWIYFKSTPPVKCIFEEIFKKNIKTFDDQRVFNEELFSQQSESLIDNIKELGGPKAEVITKNIRILILKNKIISRKTNKDAYVNHPLSPLDEDIEEFLKKSDLWIY